MAAKVFEAALVAGLIIFGSSTLTGGTTLTTRRHKAVKKTYPHLYTRIDIFECIVSVGHVLMHHKRNMNTNLYDIFDRLISYEKQSAKSANHVVDKKYSLNYETQLCCHCIDTYLLELRDLEELHTYCDALSTFASNLSHNISQNMYS